MSLTDEEARHQTIMLLTAETDRDRQVKVGASNLCNGCEFCLASNLMGDPRSTPMLDRVWGGRVLGTAIHSIAEQRAHEPWFRERHPHALVEHHMIIGEIPGYGTVGSTADLVLPDERQVFDYKGSTKKKLAILIDFIFIQSGREAPYGRTHKDIKLSEREYAEEMRKMEFKVTGYYGQLSLYGLGLWRSGIPIDRMTLNFVSRDSTMYFDNPALERYDDPKASKGVWSLGFNYSESYALAVWNRALNIWAALQAGGTPQDFPRHELCFPCSLDIRDGIATQVSPTVKEMAA